MFKSNKVDSILKSNNKIMVIFHTMIAKLIKNNEELEKFMTEATAEAVKIETAYDKAAHKMKENNQSIEKLKSIAGVE